MSTGDERRAEFNPTSMQQETNAGKYIGKYCRHACTAQDINAFTGALDSNTKLVHSYRALMMHFVSSWFHWTSKALLNPIDLNSSTVTTPNKLVSEVNSYNTMTTYIALCWGWEAHEHLIESARWMMQAHPRLIAFYEDYCLSLFLFGKQRSSHITLHFFCVYS